MTGKKVTVQLTEPQIQVLLVAITDHAQHLEDNSLINSLSVLNRAGEALREATRKARADR
jgi:hypothetical protein